MLIVFWHIIFINNLGRTESVTKKENVLVMLNQELHRTVKNSDNLSSTGKEKMRLILISGNHSDYEKFHEPEGQFVSYIQRSFSKLA